MEKTIVIDGKNITFKSNAATLLKYKSQTGREMLADFMKLADFSVSNNYDKLDTTIIFDLIWVLAKTADNSIPAVDRWLENFETFPLMDVLPELVTLISNTLTVKSKN